MLKNLLLPLALTQNAQAAAPPPEPPSEPPAWLTELAQRVDLYGRFDAHLAFTRDDVTVANNSSRIGVMAEQTVLGELRLLGQGEWRVNVGQGDTQYNIAENPDTGFATVSSSKRPALETRLGYVGVRFGKYGMLTLGKQWGVYYDVSFWTDQYTVFGAHGSSTYNAGTDGGQTGEGRANDALVYRIALGPFSLGAQAQFHAGQGEVVDSVAGSVIYRLGRGLRLGAAYSHAFLALPPGVVGYDGKDAQALTAGITFEHDGWKVAALDTWTRNHELVSTPSASVAYDTLGAELFVSRRFQDLLMVYGGFDFAIPQDLDPRYVAPDFGNRDFVAGVRCLLYKKTLTYVYLEGRTGETRDASGERAEDVVTLGIRLDYSFRRGLGLERIPEYRLNP